MKHYQKMFSCLMIVALCASGMMLGACRTKKQKAEAATNAAVNAMLMTNPMGSMFGNSQLHGSGSSPARAPEAVTGIGCPAIDLSLSVELNPLPTFQGHIDLAYNNNCIVNGLEMSGEVQSTWSILVALTGIKLQSTVTFDNLTMEGMHTDGTISQLLYVKDLIPYMLINTPDGPLTTTHADGKTRTMEFDNLTATVDLGNLTQFDTIFPGVKITDNNTAALVINGEAKYKDENNLKADMTFEDVKQPFGCMMPTSGILYLVNDREGFEATIDYSYGDTTTCDTWVTITVKGQDPQNIDLAQWIIDHQ